MDISVQGFPLFRQLNSPQAFLELYQPSKSSWHYQWLFIMLLSLPVVRWREWLDWKKLQGNVLEGEMWRFNGVVEGVDQWASFCSLIIGPKSFSIVFFILPLQMLLILPIPLNTSVLWIWSILGVWVLNFILGLVEYVKRIRAILI